MDNKVVNNSSQNVKPVIDLLALWDEVDDMISERRAIEGEITYEY